MSVPFSTFVVKVASRCNLNCDYCYMYNLQDQTYRNQPAVMLDDVVEKCAERILQHAQRNGLSSIHFIMHGGEPLLAGKKRLRKIVNLLREKFAGSNVEPRFSIQSNGTLIDDEWIQLLLDLDIRIGISVDGPKQVHDKHRLDHYGQGSYDRVVDSIRRLLEHQHGDKVFSNVLAVVDTEIDPSLMLEFWNEIGVTGFDLSLPHANHVHRPPRPIEEYRDWLIGFFDGWFDKNEPQKRIRYFDNMIRMMFGYPISTDNIGGKPVDVLVIETDGSLEPTDAFKCCFDGVTKLGANLVETDLDDLSKNSMIAAFQEGASGLCDKCQECPARDICGGGYMHHRYGADGKFMHPSVYCEALLPLIEHIHQRVAESLPTDVRELAA